MAANIIHSLRAIVDSNGIPSNGALIYVYEATTSTLRPIYSDSGLSTPAANPIVCTGGICPLRYTGVGTYKVTVTTSAGASLSAYDGDNIDTGVAVGSGDLAVADGGTGAGTPAGARTNLGAASSSTVSSLSSDVATLQTRVGSTDATTVAVGTTAQEPAVGAGKIRFDSTTGRWRASNASAWANLPRSGEIVPADFATGVAICRQKILLPTTAVTAITATTPALDASIPLISEGTQVLTQAVTPKSAASTFYLTTRICGTFPSNNDVVASIHQSGSVNAVASDFIRFSGVDGSFFVVGTFAPGNTTPLTFSVRLGVSGGTFTLNHGVNNLGGVVPSFLLIEEWETI